MRLLFLMLFFFGLGLSAPSELRFSGCVKVDRCSCLMRDGSGLIDLGSVADDDGFILQFEPVKSQGNTDVLLSFSPCVAFSQPEDQSSACADVASCVITMIHQDNTFINQYLNYGRHEGSKFSYDDSNKTLTVSYFVSAVGEPLTVVHYRCSSNHSVSSSVSLSGGAPTVHVWVESPCACPSACALVDVGPGTIFLIFLCLSVTAYFITGSCALRPFRSGNGVQISPEERVWCMSCYQLTERKRNLTHRL